MITLLSDDDPEIYRTVRGKLVACGPGVREWLHPHLLSDDPVLRRRAHEICEHFGRLAADDRFLAFCLRQGEDLDLEQGLWLLAQTRHPEARTEGYQAVLDQFAGTLREQVVFARGARAILSTINQYLFHELGFSGNTKDYYDADNSYLNKVIDRRLGIPISLCALYLLVTRRLHLPITGIGLPGHFVCRFQSSTDEVYIDCFNEGRLMTKGDCIHAHMSGHYDLQDEYLTPLSSRRVLIRMCGNLQRIYHHLKAGDEVTRFQRYLVALGR